MGSLRWPFKPKHHVPCICFELVASFFFSATWKGDFLKGLLWKQWPSLSLKTSQAFQELAWFMRWERYNCRKYHCFVDEDCIGFIKGLCRRVHRRMLELRVLGRWMICLGAYRRKPKSVKMKIWNWDWWVVRGGETHKWAPDKNHKWMSFLRLYAGQCSKYFRHRWM